MYSKCQSVSLVEMLQFCLSVCHWSRCGNLKLCMACITQMFLIKKLESIRIKETEVGNRFEAEISSKMKVACSLLLVRQ